MRPIGTGLSQGTLTRQEKTLFEYSSTSERGAVMNHFWVTGDPSNYIDDCIIRYYIDGESEASIEFTPASAAGVGFGEETAPWTTSKIGKAAQKGGWFHKLLVPFQTIKITYQRPNEAGVGDGLIWLIVRGLDSPPPLQIGSLTLPANTRLVTQTHQKTLQPLEYYDLATVGKGTAGLLFMSSLFVSGSMDNWNFMEGCFRLFRSADETWDESMLLATGMEDYYDSAFYFDAGLYHGENSGNTHRDDAQRTWSGYRFHEIDPIVFHDGLRLQWRNGDTTDPRTRLKCTLQQGGATNGEPGVTNATSLAWVYTW